LVYSGSVKFPLPHVKLCIGQLRQLTVSRATCKAIFHLTFTHTATISEAQENQERLELNGLNRYIIVIISLIRLRENKTYTVDAKKEE
jgi:hypothetical protein